MDCSHKERDLLVCFGVTLVVSMAEEAAQIVDPPRFAICTVRGHAQCPTSSQLHQLNQHFTGGAGGVGGRLPGNLVEMNETQMNSTDSTGLAGGGQPYDFFLFPLKWGISTVSLWPVALSSSILQAKKCHSNSTICLTTY